MKNIATQTPPIGYWCLTKGKFVTYDSKEHRETQKAKKSAARKSALKTPRAPTPLAELKAYARKVGKFDIAGTYMKVDDNGISLIVDTEEPYFAENQLMAYVQTGDLEPFIEVTRGIYLDADYEDDAADILPLFGIEMDTE